MAARYTSSWIIAVMALAPASALAHTGLGDTTGFSHGFLHPVSGIDHVLAMVLVGALAWQRGGAARWALPASFVLLMILGGVLGVAGVAVPFVEIGIALSVAVLGAALAFAVRASVLASAAVVGVFAVAHGYAHGAEMPVDAGGFAYGLGFVVATALLHLCGLGAGALLAPRGLALRAAGGVAGVVGVALLAGLG